MRYVDLNISTYFCDEIECYQQLKQYKIPTTYNIKANMNVAHPIVH